MNHLLIPSIRSPNFISNIHRSNKYPAGVEIFTDIAKSLHIYTVSSIIINSTFGGSLLCIVVGYLVSFVLFNIR